MIRRSTVLAAVLAAGALAACSSSGGAGAPGSTAAGNSGQATANATGTQLEIGMICSCSGPFGISNAAAGKVAQAWVKTINAKGGIDGHPVHLTAKDDASNPGTAVTDAQALINARVDVILDVSVLDSAWAKQVDAAKIPVVGGNFSATMYYTDPNWFPSGQTQDSVITSSILTAKTAGVTNFGELYCAESPSCAEGVGPRRAAGKRLGVPDVYDSAISATAPNYTAQCVAAKQAKAQAMYVGGSATTIARIAQDCAKQDYHPLFLQNGTGYTALEAQTQGLNDELWASFPNLPYFAKNAQLQSMNAATDKYYPGLRKNPEAWSQYVVQAWAAGILLEHALRGAKVAPSSELTPAVVTDGLQSIKNDTLEGLAPPLTFTAGKTHSVDCWYTGRLRDGTPKLVDNGKLTCMKGS